jgi:hypothetical protein
MGRLQGLKSAPAAPALATLERELPNFSTTSSGRRPVERAARFDPQVASGTRIDGHLLRRISSNVRAAVSFVTLSSAGDERPLGCLGTFRYLSLRFAGTRQ